MGSVTWIFLFCLILSTFTNSLQYESKVLKNGQNIELTCEDDEPIHWCYPPKYKNPDDPVSTDYSSSTTEKITFESKHKTTLKIEKSSYIYTGFYHCVRNDSKTPCNRKMENVKSTYIFVQDPAFPLVVYGHIVVKVFKYGALTLPCLPTHPDVKITLIKDGVEVLLGKQEDSNLMVTYHDTMGYVLEPFTVTEGGFFSCIADSFSTNNELMFDIEFETMTKYLTKPTIMRNSGFPIEIFIREGESLKLICHRTDTDVASVTFEWNIPNQSKKHTELSDCKQNGHLCKDSILTVNNITSADAGNYNCRLKSESLTSVVSSVYVKVIGEHDAAINVTSSWIPDIPVKMGKEPMKIAVDYTAPENISVVWYGPDGKAIETVSNKYNIQTTNRQTILYVMNISLQDAGLYKVQLFDKNKKSVWYNTTVNIQDKPEIHLISSSILFNPGKTSNFSCKVYSPAPVNIELTFTKCNLTEDVDCEGDETVILNRTTIKKFERVYVVNVTLEHNEEGIIHCNANNTCNKNCGSSSKFQKIYLSELQELNHSLSIIDKPEVIVTGSTLTLSCAGSTYFFKSYPFWELYSSQHNIYTPLNNTKEISIQASKSQYTFFSNLTFHKILRAHNGQCIRCSTKNVPAPEMCLEVQDPEKPTIILTNLNKDIKVELSDPVTLYCKTKGVPKPKLKWLKDGVPVNSDNRIRIHEKNESITIRTVMPEHEGLYSCEANSTTGKTEKKAQLIVTGKPGPISVGLLATILVLVPILLALIIFLVVKIRKERKLQRELNLAGLANFEKGAMENINPELPVDEQADLLPYDKTWEFPVERLKLGKLLGAGAFGVVMKAEAYGILEDEDKTTVAVKMVKNGADRSYIRALASELKIMTHLGKHLNVVNLLGASTKRLNKMELMVIVEFCRFGNIQNYLIRHRDDFVDQVDHNTGEINLSIGMDKLARSQSTKSKTTLKHRLLSYSSSLIGSNMLRGSNSELRVPASPAETEITGVASDMSVVSSPNGESDECLLSNGSGPQPDWRVKYSGDYGDSSISLCTQNLLCWGFQIARGMDYLASRKVLHGDLAARNVLLADENIVKICDFGLARSMYKSDNYKKKGGGPLPVKWMALESIRDHMFSTQSDVWSFGIVLWELFSLSRTPYPGMEANERLLEKLLNGYRMEQPSYSPNAVYKTMLKCWQEKPNDRPSFAELAEELGAMLDDNLRRHFEELNDPYMDMNAQRHSNNDYLSMMGSPNYGNLVSPTSAHGDYINSPHPSGSDYLNMRNATSPMSTNGSVFEFSPAEGSESGYLRMSAKDEIFSPRHTEGNPFKFAPGTSNENKKESYPMKTMQIPNSENYVNVGPSVTNPSYILSKPQEL